MVDKTADFWLTRLRSMISLIGAISDTWFITLNFTNPKHSLYISNSNIWGNLNQTLMYNNNLYYTGFTDTQSTSYESLYLYFILFWC